jgi:hypothetical protein
VRLGVSLKLTVPNGNVVTIASKAAAATARGYGR